MAPARSTAGKGGRGSRARGGAGASGERRKAPTPAPSRPSGRSGPPNPSAPPADRDEARRVWGQNFFRTAGAAGRFARQLTAVPDAGSAPTVVEIGAGAGRITKALAAGGHSLTAVEVDPYWAGRLTELELGDLTVVQHDFLTWPVPEAGPLCFIGNLPFGAGTDILRRCLGLGPDRCREGVFLLQKQFTRKRTGAYGGNLFNAQWEPWYTFRRGLAFPRTQFTPVPSSDTETLLVRPRPAGLVPWSRHAAYQRFVEQVYGTSRLTIGEADRVLAGRRPAVWLREAGLTPGTRIKDVTAAQWADLFRQYARPPGQRRPPRRS